MTSPFATATPHGYKRPSGSATKKAQGQEGRRGVQRSAEIARILALPRRSDGCYTQAFADALTSELVASKDAASSFRLKPKQAAMLVEAVEACGLFGMVGVGAGKSFCAPLFGHVMDIPTTVMLVPAQIKIEIETHVIPHLLKHIDFKPPIVVSYSELSTANKNDILDRLKPGLIVCDEVHMLKSKTAARTKRFLRYFDNNPDTLLVALSGTITRRSLMDFWHLMHLTHRGWKAPITRHWKEAQDWALALDPQVLADQRLHPGALLELCAPGEDARAGFRRRMLDTDGVIGGSAEDVGASLLMRKRDLDIPDAVAVALTTLRHKWTTPDGELVTDALEFARRARELAQGFYYVWDWPDGEIDHVWLTARANWRRAVADVCRLSRPGLDSEFLVRNAAIRASGLADGEAVVTGATAELPKAQRKALIEAWAEWRRVKHQEDPPVRAVWIDDYVVRAAMQWGEQHGGLIWYDSRAIEERALVLGALVCGAGNSGNQRLLALSTTRAKNTPAVFLSVHAHGTGKNLQRWAANLVLAPWSGGATWEQTIGRTHRPGQDADEVTIDVFAHTQELQKALDTALEQARYIADVTGGAQKMLLATWTESR